MQRSNFSLGATTFFGTASTFVAILFPLLRFRACFFSTKKGLLGPKKSAFEVGQQKIKKVLSSVYQSHNWKWYLILNTLNDGKNLENRNLLKSSNHPSTNKSALVLTNSSKSNQMHKPPKIHSGFQLQPPKPSSSSEVALEPWQQLWIKPSTHCDFAPRLLEDFSALFNYLANIFFLWHEHMELTPCQ